MQVEECLSDDAFGRLRTEWTDLHRRSPARSPFLAWEWLRAWRRVLNPAVRLRLVCVRDGGRLQAAAPLVRRRTRYYGVPLTETSFLGDPVSDRQAFLHSADAPAALATLWAYLLARPAGASILRLDQVPSDSDTIATGLAGAGRTETELSARLPFVPLVGDWAAFEKGLTKKFRSEMRTRLKVFEALGPTSVGFVRGPEVARYLPRMAEVERLSAKMERGYPFLSEPRHARFLEALIADPGPEIEPILSLLTVGGCDAAYLFGILFDGKYHAYNTAYRPEYRKGMPGKYLVHQTIRFCYEQGLREFDFLRGAHWMKHEWNPGTRTNVRMVHFYRGAVGPLLRFAVFRARPFLKARLRRGVSGEADGGEV